MFIGSKSFALYALVFIGILSVAYITLIINDDHYISFAQQDQNFSISSIYQHYVPLSSGDGNQVKVNVTYVAPDSSYLNQRINAVMEVYAPNSTLIRTSSFGDGFVVNSTQGQIQLATTLTDPSLNQVRAEITLTDLSKSNYMSNTFQTDLTLSENSTTVIGEESATISDESIGETTIDDETISEEESATISDESIGETTIDDETISEEEFLDNFFE